MSLKNIITISFVIAILSAHYTEVAQTKLIIKARNLVYFGSFDSVNKKSNGLISRYQGVEDGIINPVDNAQTVLQGAENYLTQKYYPEAMRYVYGSGVLDKEKLINTVDWFIGHYREEMVAGVNLVRLPYDMDLKIYDIRKPWYSGMAQGHAVIISLAAFDITGEVKYLDFAHKLIKVLNVPVENGGVKSVMQSGVWFEEYADRNRSASEQSKVLNGNIFAIDGLFWYWHFNNKTEDYALLLKSSIEALDSEIVKYNSLFWSYYDLYKPKNYADASYHSIHIKQLYRVKNLYARVAGVNVLYIEKVADRFSLYRILPFGFVERLIFQHNEVVVLILLLNMFVVASILIIITKCFRKHR